MFRRRRGLSAISFDEQATRLLRELVSAQESLAEAQWAIAYPDPRLRAYQRGQIPKSVDDGPRGYSLTRELATRIIAEEAAR